MKNNETTVFQSGTSRKGSPCAMHRRSFLRRVFALALASLALAQHAFAAPSAKVPLQVSPGRATTLAIWEPAQARGVVLFSSGHGAWPERYERLLQSWADAGFVVLAPLHVDSLKYPGSGIRNGKSSRCSRASASAWPTCARPAPMRVRVGRACRWRRPGTVLAR